MAGVSIADCLSGGVHPRLVRHRCDNQITFLQITVDSRLFRNHELIAKFWTSFQERSGLRSAYWQYSFHFLSTYCWPWLAHRQTNRLTWGHDCDYQGFSKTMRQTKRDYALIPGPLPHHMPNRIPSSRHRTETTSGRDQVFWTKSFQAHVLPMQAHYWCATPRYRTGSPTPSEVQPLSCQRQ